MIPKYNIGQHVMVQKASDATAPVRDNTLEAYLNKYGSVTKSYWISPNPGEVFYLYTVRFPDSGKEIVLYEDEMKPAL